METFVKVFKNRKLQVAVDEANIYAENRSLEIVSAQVYVLGEGRSYEESHVTVVYRKVRKRNKPGGEV